jgi:hypothetical protein
VFVVGDLILEAVYMVDSLLRDAVDFFLKCIEWKEY